MWRLKEEKESASNIFSHILPNCFCRKDVFSLDEVEYKRLVTALNRLIDSGKFVNLSNFHGHPPTICPSAPDGVCCPHKVPAFLPWHRLYVAQMEEELGEALPYWDWTKDAELPGLWSERPAPMKEGVNSTCLPLRFASRNSTIRINKEQLRSMSKAAFLERDYSSFVNQISIPHDSLHDSIGCDMGTIKTAAYDPIFFLHHSYVDYQWAFWQELQRLRGLEEKPLKSGEVENLGEPLAPFNLTQHNGQERTFR